ncbi:MAG: hypothetical protein AAFY34_12415 [Pseudomonadota bacterium]
MSYNQPSRFDDPQVTDFAIRTGTPELQKLGTMLNTFGELRHQRLFWSPTLTVIDNELRFRDRRTGNNLEAAFESLPNSDLSLTQTGP